MDERVKRFALGQLEGAELEAFERDLDEDPMLRRAVAQVASTEEGMTLLAGDSANVAPEPLERGLLLQRVLGRGGMARVLLARQVELGRDVAVKMVREPSDRALTARLLKEARLTGALEHPVIVPVHFIATDESGAVQVVLKRVEGEPWSALKDDAEVVRARFGAERLEWNLRVLVSVCTALAFAHERGVIHRDVKPSNVMIGRHGEVYLVDWGLGGLLTPDDTNRLPWVGEAVGAGTLAYMAPEQFPDATHPLSPATDVYLAGAVLFELLTGAPPFPRRTTLSLGPGPKDVPPLHVSPSLQAFAALARRALDPDPSRRFASATELKLALEHALRKRETDRLLERAAELLTRAGLARRDGRTDEAAQVGAEASFLVRTVREAWPEDARALELSDQLVQFLVESALADGRPAVAAQALATHHRSWPDLSARVRVASEKAEQLERLARELDPTVGRRRRVGFVFAFAAQLAVFFGARLVFPSLYTGRWALALSSVAFLVAFLALSRVFQDVILGSRLNRQMAQLIVVLTVGQAAARAAAAGLEVPRSTAAALELPVLITTLLGGAVTLHWSYGLGAAVCMVGQVAAVLWPQSAERIFFLSSMSTVLTIGVAWAVWARHQDRSASHG